MNESNSGSELLKSALEAEKSEFEEKLNSLSADNTDLQDKIDISDQEINRLNSVVQVRC